MMHLFIHSIIIYAFQLHIFSGYKPSCLFILNQLKDLVVISFPLFFMLFFIIKRFRILRNLLLFL